MRHSIKIVATLIALFSMIFTGASAPLITQNQQNGIVLQITQVDTSQFPLIKVYISIRTAQGEPLPINPAKLVLKENGVPINSQTIQGTETVNSLTSFLLFDISGSMNFAGKLDAAKAAAKDYIAQLRTQDKTGIITFNTRTTVVSDISSNSSALSKAVDTIQASGDTAMYDALLKAVNILNPLPGRKAIIVLTDGMDNSSTSTPENVLSSIGYTGLSISTIGLGIAPSGETQPDKLKGLDQPTLQMMAQKAGGSYGFVEDKQSLTELYDQMRRAMQSEVVITYTTPLNLRDGVSRALTVELADDTTGVGKIGQKNFNPGGLVPEVAKPASWLVFGIVLIVLLLLVALPIVLSMIRNNTEKKKPNKKKSRIKLLD